MSLVLWIARFKHDLNPNNWVDDVYGVEIQGRMSYYLKYDTLMPLAQVRLLQLWDELNLSHDQLKQLSHALDPEVPVIGLDVDPNAMTATLPAEAKQCRSLREFQSFAGYANWAFNIFPLLKPGLCNIYAKTAGKTQPHAGIFVNSAIVSDLQWMVQHIRVSDGVHFLGSEDWSPADISEDDENHVPWHNIGLWADIPCAAPKDAIFWFEALAACSAVHYVAYNVNYPVKRLVVFSDNTNTVALFNTFHALLAYNLIIKSVVNALLAEDLQLRVGHISGKENIIADALSRGQLDEILKFSPPRDTLGGVKK
ncbi:hypothetical protein BKA93DRAFT_815012 [Sparassis latifolia]